jgi:hypothetical protein
MIPIVHGLEKRYAQFTFLYFDVSDPATAPLRAKIGFKSTPQFFLLAADGAVLGERRGVMTEALFEKWLKDALSIR